MNAKSFFSARAALAGASGLAFAAVGLAQEAAAQDLTRGQGVLQRRRPETEVRGIPAGGFNVFPLMYVGGEYNDNIFARDGGETGVNGDPIGIEDDFVLNVAPEVNVESTWSRHLLSATGWTELRRHADFTGEDSTDYGGNFLGRVDVQRNTTVTFDGLFDRRLENRISSGLADDVAERPQVYRYGGGVEVSHVVNRVRATLGGQFRRWDVEGAGQDFRDREIGAYAGRLEYIVSPSTSIFVRGNYIRTQYDNTQNTFFDINGDGLVADVDLNGDGDLNDPGDLNEQTLPAFRDNEAIRVAIGSVFEISRLLQGDVSIGYLETRYDSPFFSDVGGIDLDIGLTWFATQLTTVEFRGGSSVEDAVIPGSSGYLNYFGQVSVDHELRRNILLTATVSYSEDDYDGITREDQRFAADAGLDYFLNRNAAVTLRYTYQDRDTNFEELGYTQNIVFLGMRGQI